MIFYAVVGDKELLSKLNRLRVFWNGSELLTILDDSGRVWADLARASVPVSSNPSLYSQVSTGAALRNSIKYSVNNFGTPGVNVTITAGGPNVPYASFVEFGTGPSSRVPRTKKAMFWVENGGGQKVNLPPGMRISSGLLEHRGFTANFRFFVNHPGTKPQPFFFKHGEIMVPWIVQRIRQAIERQWAARF